MDALGILLEQHLIYPMVTQTPKGFMVTSQMKMIWVNAEKPEDRIIIDWYCAGEQKDPSQALGSALTYSERYFLLDYLGIPRDEDDPDSFQTKTENGKIADKKIPSPTKTDTGNDPRLEKLLGLAFESEKTRKAFVDSFKGGEEQMIKTLKARIDKGAGINE